MPFLWSCFLNALTAVHAAVVAPPLSPPPTPLPLRGDSLVLELGCIQCHADLPGRSPIREQAPNLSQAGLKYRTSYLFDYLQRPTQVRRHIGRARMPDFHLTEKEALALALFFETQKQNPNPAGRPPWPERIRAQLETSPRTVTKAEFERELSGGLLCLACHTLNGQGGSIGSIAPELTNVGHQLQPAWLTTYLVAPSLFGVAPSVMPAQFFQLSEEQTRFEPIVPNPDQQLATIVGYLVTAGAPRAAELDRNLARTKSVHPDVTAIQGEQLFRALNCAACHRLDLISPRDNAAPALASEGLRVHRPWLESFLRKPTALRPAGYHPGDGSRMPDFHLSEGEAVALAQFLATLRQPMPYRERAEKPAYTNATSPVIDQSPSSSRPLSAFAQDKAHRLLTEKLSCLGCHRLDGSGGVIGPELNTVKTRLLPDYVLAIISEANRVAPHSIMPRVPLPRETAQLLARYLLERDALSTSNVTYLSPLEGHLKFPPPPSPTPAPTAATPDVTRSTHSNYLRHCAPCHGSDGRGDGFNAPFLTPAKPTAFADTAYLARRPDDTLFDGIHSGGAILNRSPLMPPWGATFSVAEIRALVKHLRGLCQCEGPDWSRDGSTNATARAGRADSN